MCWKLQVQPLRDESRSIQFIWSHKNTHAFIQTIPKPFCFAARLKKIKGKVKCNRRTQDLAMVLVPTAECCGGVMTAGQLHLNSRWRPGLPQRWPLRCSAACLWSGTPCRSGRCCRKTWRDQRCLRRCREGPLEMPGYSSLSGHRFKLLYCYILFFIFMQLLSF